MLSKPLDVTLAVAPALSPDAASCGFSPDIATSTAARPSRGAILFWVAPSSASEPRSAEAISVGPRITSSTEFTSPEAPAIDKVTIRVCPLPGRSRKAANLPSRPAVSSAIMAPSTRMRTTAPGAATPAIRAEPSASTRTTSKVGGVGEDVSGGGEAAGSTGGATEADPPASTGARLTFSAACPATSDARVAR